MIYVTKRTHFNAAHRLHNDALSEEENWRLFGLCNNKNYHGHNYDLEVTVCGMPDEISGYVIDLKALSELIQERLLDKLDHKNLNLDVDFLHHRNPTGENIVLAIWQELVGAIPPPAKLFSVKLWETPHNLFEYKGE